MNPGLLRHIITVQSHTETRGDGGEIVYGWKDESVWWAAINPLSGRELQYAQQVHADARVKILMRFYDGLQPDWRILFGERVFNILAVRNLDERGEYTEAMCVEVV